LPSSIPTNSVSSPVGLSIPPLWPLEPPVPASPSPFPARAFPSPHRLESGH
jgi:hypothetical protein